MKNRRLLTLPLVLLCCIPASFAAEVYTWRNANGNRTYSDVPRRLQPAHTDLVNVRTHTVYAPAVQTASDNGSASIAEQQNQLNKKITQANKTIEAQNKKVEEENRQMKDDNCNAARLNREYAESARTANRESLKQRYDADIAKYCN